MKRRAFLTGVAALAAYSQIEEAEAIGVLLLGKAVASNFPISGSVIDLDFLRGRYFGGSPGSLIANSNSTGGFAVNSNGTLTSVGANLTRIGSGVGLFSEAAATNNQTFGSDFSNAVWTKNGIGTGIAPTVTTDAGVAPDGTTTADRIQFNLGATPATAFSRVFSTINAAANSAPSVWLKSNDGQNHILYMVAVGGSRPTILITATWQLFTKPMNTGLGLEFGLSGAAGTDTTADILASFGDLENGVGTPAWPTSTIATASTRSADSLSFIGAAVAAAAAGASTVRYLDLATGYLTATNFVAGAFSFPTNAIIQRITIYNPVTTPGVGTNATIYFDGNSLTTGTNATTSNATYPVGVLNALAKLGYSIAPHNVAISGQTTPQMNTAAFTNVDSHIAGSTSPFIDIFWELTNDILLNNVTGAQAYANYVTYAQNRRAAMRAGDKLVALTCLPRGAASGWTGANETARLAANALVVADTTNWNMVIDVTTISQIQAPTNKTYYEQTNQTHLTDLGYQYLWQAVTSSVQVLLPAAP